MSTIHALMVAAGRGTRFGATVPKQYLAVNGCTIIEHSIKRLDVPEICDITLVVANDDVYAHQLNVTSTCPLYFAIGGAERFLSVKSGVDAIRQRGAKDNDWVLIHDAVRPCLSSQELYSVIDRLSSSQSSGVILATPVVDTLKRSCDGFVQATINREQLYHAQTPQAFRLKALEDMLVYVIANQVAISDEARGFELLCQPIELVSGSKTNVKLTYREDLPLIQAILTANLHS